MKDRSYKVIFILLSLSVLSILTLQGYWIRNFYLQKTEAFRSAVYQTMEQLVTKLQDRRNLQVIKMTYLIQDGDTIVKTPSRNKITVKTESHTRFINHVGSQVITKQLIRQEDNGGHKSEEDSVVINGNDRQLNIILGGKRAKLFINQKTKNLNDFVKENNLASTDSNEIKHLLDKMITEIKVSDTEVENADTLSHVIKKALVNKGIFIPFEFSIQKIKENKRNVLVQSKGFSSKDSSYQSDLSVNRVIPTHEFLFLQFPGQKDLLMAGMKDSLILSLFFSFMILSIFYSVLRLILRQKKLSEIKNDFVNNMTHELKTPIATISLAIDAMNNPLIKNDELRYAEYTRILKEENKKLNSHVERVLQMAMLDKGELKLDKKEVDPQVLLNKAIESYQLQIREKRAQINFVQSEELIKVVGDAFHLQNAFANLMDNALKYSAEHCRIDISVTKLQGDVYIHFTDNGIGIAANEHVRIFDKFYRVQGGNLHDVKGFGLGLSYVKSIVEAHGGSIELKSEKDKGSEFVLRFKSA